MKWAKEMKSKTGKFTALEVALEYGGISLHSKTTAPISGKSLISFFTLVITSCSIFFTFISNFFSRLCTRLNSTQPSSVPIAMGMVEVIPALYRNFSFFISKPLAIIPTLLFFPIILETKGTNNKGEENRGIFKYFTASF